jgi:FkbM family methyltransferase
MKPKDIGLMQNTVIEKYEVRPMAEALGYLHSWFAIRGLAKKVSSRDYKFFLDVSSGVDRAILNSGTFEKAIVEIIKTVCISTQYTDQLVDIGANIGNHSVNLANVFKKVAAIEPNPVIFKVLEANLLRNNIRNALCYNFGLAEHVSSATLVATAENHSLGKVKQHTTLGAGAFNIDESAFDIEYDIQLESTATFFERFTGTNSKTFIKIDVEGMEQEILTQLLPFIRAEEPIVGFEWYVREQLGIKDIIDSLPNYNAYVIDSNEKPNLNPVFKAVHLLLKGRKFKMERYNPLMLKDSYPLVMLIPSRLSLSNAAG